MTDSEDLTALAGAHGVATSYKDWRGRPHAVPEDTIRALLRAVGAPAHDHAAVSESLEVARLRPWRRLLPPAHVVRLDQIGAVRAHMPAGAHQMELWLEDGSSRSLAPPSAPLDERLLDGTRLEAREIALPTDLPIGDHSLRVALSDGRHAECLVTVAPARCPLPQRTQWGWMLQLYALRSTMSWGIGDLSDLRHLGEVTAVEFGGDFLVCNPLHAATPLVPQQPSPYYPSSRRFFNPLYLRIEEVPELHALNREHRDRVTGLAREAHALNGHHRIDHDAVFHVKQSALETLYHAPRSAARHASFAAYRARNGEGLERFATFCALAEQHGVPYQSWPVDLRHPQAAGVRAARRALARRVDYHAWLQWLLDEQLAEVHASVVAAGMRLGIIHDLAVGADPGGADAWSLPDEFATGVTIGAPPDAFNQQGQDWGLAPFLPNALAATSYAAVRDLLRQTLQHAGGIRIDHILGLFRLYWIPEGAGPGEGSYVRYPTEDLLGVLALEAQRAGAVVVGEDLGTVPEGVREALAERRLLGSRVLYFERDAAGRRLLPGDYPALALTSVTTHDLPTAAGWWTDEELRVQADLGLFGADTSVEAERERKASERAELEELVRRAGLIGDEPTVTDLIGAMYEFLASTPSLLIAATPSDAVGDRRQPNLPGTVDEYPNWRLPLASGAPGQEEPIMLEAFLRHPDVRALVARLRRDPPAAGLTR